MAHVRDEKGASSVEYGMILAAVAAMIVVVVFAFGDIISGLYTGTCAGVNSETQAHGIASASC